MIAFVRGTLTAREAGRVVVETASGIGLELLVPDTTQRHLPEPGQPVRLYTHLLVREDHWTLAGFWTLREREIFQVLLNVSGVGPKVALAVLGQVGIDELTRAVAEGRWQRLREVSGVGPKLAQRLVVELRGVLADAPVEPGPPAAAEVADEVWEGLRALGYTDAEARAALAGLEEGDPAERLRKALARLDKSRGVRHG
jgi:Holliday junction DNA helicase RuvA